jgi:signal transduction histidine kinase
VFRVGHRIAALLLLLATALGLSAALTWRAFTAERRHREAAARFLADYAGILSDDIVRRMVFEYESFWFIPLRAEIAGWLEQAGRPPTLEEIRNSPRERAHTAGAVIDAMFTADFAKGTVTPSVSPEIDAWILRDFEKLAVQRRKEDMACTIRASFPDGDRWFVYVQRELTKRKVYGVVIRFAALPPIATTAFRQRHVLPPAFSNRGVSDDEFFLTVTTHAGELFRNGHAYEPALGMTYRAPATYPEPLANALVRTSFSREGAALLIPGGVPRSRVELLIGMLVMTGGVLAAAIFVVIRERQLEILRSDLVAGVSHELRTPLTHIRMFTETLMLGRVRSDAERRRSLQIVHQEAGRHTNLVDNLLFFERNGRKTMPIAKENVDFGAVVRSAVESFAPIAASKHAVVQVDAEDAGNVMGDPDALKQVVINLLDNAIKYGPAGQTVTVRAARDNGTAILTVDDQGLGIPERDRANVWQKFYRLSRDRGTHKTGSGIGLAVVREIVERHGGSCRVEDAPAGGARFVIAL